MKNVNWYIVIALCLTLGLAPFKPEPHIWGKLKWIAGGANDMKLLDWLDVLFHGLPWLLLCIKINSAIGKSLKHS